MRYHWGLGIGHVYSHGKDIQSQQDPIALPIDDAENAEDELPEPVCSGPPEQHGSGAEDPNVDDFDSSGSAQDSDGEDDEELLELHGTYNSD